MNRKWQFVPAVKVEVKPKPQLALVDGKPEPWKCAGSSFLGRYEDGKRKTKIAGVSPRNALDEWQLQAGILPWNIEAPDAATEGTKNTILTVNAAIENQA